MAPGWLGKSGLAEVAPERSLVSGRVMMPIEKLRLAS